MTTGPNGGKILRTPASGPFFELLAELVGVNPLVLGSNNLQTVLELLAASGGSQTFTSIIPEQVLLDGVGPAVLTSGSLVIPVLAGQLVIIESWLSVGWDGANSIECDIDSDTEGLIVAPGVLTATLVGEANDRVLYPIQYEVSPDPGDIVIDVRASSTGAGATVFAGHLKITVI